MILITMIKLRIAAIHLYGDKEQAPNEKDNNGNKWLIFNIL